MRLIDAEEVIKAIDRHTFDTADGLCLDEDITIILEEVPTAQPEKHTEKRAETHACDLIDRQAAIDALHMHLMYRMGTDSNKKRLDEWINNLPSVQPEIIRCKDCIYYDPPHVKK